MDPKKMMKPKMYLISGKKWKQKFSKPKTMTAW